MSAGRWGETAAEQYLRVSAEPIRLQPKYRVHDAQDVADLLRLGMERKARLLAEARCSCGCREPHEVMRRVTDDGYTVLFWSDGSVTSRVGVYAVHPPRSLDTTVAALRANREAARDVCLYAWREVVDFVRALRAKHGSEVRNGR